MTRVAWHVAREQAGRAGVALLVAWSGTTVVVAIAGVLGGDVPLGALSTRVIAWIAALAFAPSVGVAMPIAVVAHAVRLGESGETVAAWAAGTPSRTIALGLAAPWLPFVLALGPHAHTVRPAALGALASEAQRAMADDPARSLSALAARGVAVAPHGEGFRLLAPIGDELAAVELGAPPRAVAGGFTFDAARVALLQDGVFRGASIDVAEVDLPVGVRPLSWRSERELSSAFLALAGPRFLRARASVTGRDVVRDLDVERRRRAAAWPAALVALAWALGAVGRRRPWSAFALCALPAAAIATLGPRLVGAW